MATTMKKKTVPKTESKVEEQSSATTKEPAAEKKPVKAEKKFNAEDEIMCKSIAAGATFVPGIRSKMTYEFEAENTELPVQYQDLYAFVNSKSPYLFKPFIIVEDEDFVNKFPKLKELYQNMYSANDLSRILSLSPEEVENKLQKLPVGAREAVKNIASSMIADGSLNDIRVIKAVDSVLGTDLLLMSGLYK